jgi:hypothetical protein
MRNLTSLFLFSLLVVGCTHAPLQQSSSLESLAPTNSAPSKKLSSSEVRSDVAQVIYALNSAYSGRRFLPGNEFKTLLSDLSQLTGSQTAIELCSQIDRAFEKVSDNHLNAKFLDKNCFSFRKNPGSVGPNSATDSVLPWKVEKTQRKNRRALVVSITSFPPSADPSWNGFIEKVRGLLSEVEFVIVDLRGNGGGDDSTGEKLAILLAGQTLKTPYSARWKSQTAESFQVLINSFEDWRREDLAEGKPVEHYQKLIDDLKAKRESALAGKIPSEAWVHAEKNQPAYNPAKGLKKPIYLLMDQACASSCESTIDFFEFNPSVKRVGENTAGYIHFGNNGRVYLKNSGARIQLATTYNQYVDGRFLEKKGISPDIKVPPAQDALEFAWADFLNSVPAR